ncbi:MAG: AMP-binding protein [Gammaproteobacteria bacterium]|nr:AMP-binding protein [Gammaproteobacteria bacterium]
MAMKIDRIIARHARFRPGHTAVVYADRRLDYAAYHARVSRLAAALQAVGVAKGERVMTVLPNCLELLDLYWACAAIGGVMVPLSPLLTESGLRSMLADAAPRLVVAHPKTAAAVEAALDAAPDAVAVCVGGGSGLRPLDALLAAAPTAPAAVGVAPDDLYNIMYTSGTTGMPKGIMHSHRVRAHYGTLFANAWRITPESVVLHTGAIVFNGAMVTLFPAFFQGATYVLHEQFDPAALIETVERERVTHLMLVPSQIVAVLDHPDFAAGRLASLEMLLSLGAPLHVEHKNRLEAALPGRFHELYGLTEGFVTILDKADAIRKRGSVGVPPVLSEMRIVGEDGSPVATGEVGEIVGRSPILMQGYYGRPDLTAQALRDGWLHSGDLGYVDDEGFLFLVDRKKDMIDTGGVKVYPRDVEEVAVRHPDVSEAAVFGIPDPKWGETPVAAVTLREGAGVDEETLRSWINERVAARYQRVSRVVIYPEFPRNAAGKILKREMREPFWEGRGSKI